MVCHIRTNKQMERMRLRFIYYIANSCTLNLSPSSPAMIILTEVLYWNSQTRSKL